jgi:Fe-S-cluster-containing hydrogenase component 2
MAENQQTAVGYGDHIVQFPMEYSLCAGCTTCEIACSLTHDGLVGPKYNRIFLERVDYTMIHRVHSCQQCGNHPCYDKCPKKDSAMKIDENGIVYIDEEFCIGCGLCRKACPFDPPRINLVKSTDKEKRKAKKCDLCRTRPEGPACVEWCPVRCIGLSSQSVQIPAAEINAAN